MDECTPVCMGVMLLVLGIALILVRLYTVWDMWVVVGVLLIIKAIVMFFMPICHCHNKAKKKR